MNGSATVLNPGRAKRVLVLRWLSLSRYSTGKYVQVNKKNDLCRAQRLKRRMQSQMKPDKL